MKMYIARDEDGRLNLFDVKPEKFIPQNGQETVWTVPRGYLNHIMLSRRMFPEVTFENSPQEGKKSRIEPTPFRRLVAWRHKGNPLYANTTAKIIKLIEKCKELL